MSWFSSLPFLKLVKSEVPGPIGTVDQLILNLDSCKKKSIHSPVLACMEDVCISRLNWLQVECVITGKSLLE